jgi:hypothetical protein
VRAALDLFQSISAHTVWPSTQFQAGNFGSHSSHRLFSRALRNSYHGRNMSLVPLNDQASVFGRCAFARARFAFASARLRLRFAHFSCFRCSRGCARTLLVSVRCIRPASVDSSLAVPLPAIRAAPLGIEVGCHLSLTSDANAGLSNTALHATGDGVLACTGFSSGCGLSRPHSFRLRPALLWLYSPGA